MANSESSKIDLEAASGVIDELSAAANQFQANVPLCSSCSAFGSLANAGFDTSCCASYDAEVQNLASQLVNITTSLHGYVDGVFAADQKIEQDIPSEEDAPDEEDHNDDEKAEEAGAAIDEETKADDVEESAMEGLEDDQEKVAGGTNKDGESADFDDKTKDEEKTDLEDMSDDKDKNPDVGKEDEKKDDDPPPDLKDPKKPGGGGNNKQKLFEECEKYYKSISLEVLQSILSDLYEESMAKGITLEELLSNEKYAVNLLSIINKNSKIDKAIIQKMNTIGKDKTIEILYDLFAGKNNRLGLNSKSKSSLKESLNKLAKEQNLNVDELIKNNDIKLRELIKTIEKESKENKTSSVYQLTGSMLGLNDKALSYMISTLLK